MRGRRIAGRVSVLEKDGRDGMKRGLADIVRLAALFGLLLTLFVSPGLAADRGLPDRAPQEVQSDLADGAGFAAVDAGSCDRMAGSDVADCGYAQICLALGTLPVPTAIDDAGKTVAASLRPYRIAGAARAPAKQPPRSTALV